MPTPGRNDPCPCGSGKKYKKCCFLRDDAAASPKQTAPAAPPLAPPGTAPTGWTLGEDDLDVLSNSVVKLLQAGRLDEAEKACAELHRRYPDMIDWIVRTAMLHEARGNLPEALEYWKRTLAFMQDNEGFEGQQDVQQIIDRISTTLAQGAQKTT